MKRTKLMITAGAVMMLLFSCQKNMHDPEQKSQLPETAIKNGIAGYVYTLSNQVTGNEVLIYRRTAGGVIEYVKSIPAGGNGTGAGLGSQGAVVITENSNWMLAVNAGSNTISSLWLDGETVQVKSTVASGGIMPVSVTVYNNIVYVLNGGGPGNISGFYLNADGTLQPIAGSNRPLSMPNPGPAQISFVNDGTAVAITEKATNRIITYTIDMSGSPGDMHMVNSASPTPFGFAVGKNGMIYVSEAAGGVPNASAVSSYHISPDGSITLVDGPVHANQTAACWVVITNNGKYVYATNTGSSSVSSFATGNDGSLVVSEAVAGMTGEGSSPIDAALSRNSKFLYVLNARVNDIRSFGIGHDGSLQEINTVGGLPAGAAGLAAL